MVNKKHATETKKKIALETVKEQKTISQIAKEYQVHPAQVNTWKKQLVENAANLFGAQSGKCKDSDSEIEALERKVGRLTMENDFLKKKLGA